MSVTKDTSKSISPTLLSVIIFLAVVVVWIGVRLIFPDVPTFFAGTQPENIGVTNEKLLSRPSTPNCVSSQSEDAEHSIEPLIYQGEGEQVISALKDIINQEERTEIVSETSDYLYAQFTSQWMGFIDDVEFFVNKDKGVIDVRSASRSGESDLGVNRERIESIRQALEQS